MDSFLAMMPALYKDHPEGLSFEIQEDDGRPALYARTGPVAEKLLAGMRAAIGAMAATGCNLIVDDVLFGNVDTECGNPVRDYNERLAPFQTHWVGVHAPLNVIEDREASRGDRPRGLARWQFTRVHRDMDYDFEIDVGSITAEEAARQIKDHFDL